MAFCRTVMQLNALSNMGTLVLAGLGGALPPLASLPSSASWIAPITPSYWAMRGFTDVILGGAGFAAVLGSVGMLVTFTLVFASAAALRFRFDKPKVHWA
ncbi:MAG: ABC transporter permease [Acidimicrobiales bacterium]